MIWMMIVCFFLYAKAEHTNLFESCSKSFDKEYGYSILCSKKLPYYIKTNFPKIFRLTVYDVETIGKNFFETLEINNLKILCLNLSEVNNEAFKNIKKLDVLRLSGVLDLSSFWNINTLKYLSNLTRQVEFFYLNLNSLSIRTVLDKLKSLNKLQNLIINYNYFEHLKYDFNGFNSNFSSLTLTGNSIESFEIISDQIIFLSIESNHVKNLDKDLFRKMPNLKILIANFNQISKLFNDTFLHAKNLQTINLERNNLNHIEIECFCNLKSLQTLILSYNKLEFIKLKCLEKVYNLYLSTVGLKGIVDQERIGNPLNAYLLDLSNNKIDSLIFRKMTQLKILKIGSNNLKNLTLETILSLHYLSNLYISSNKFRDESIEKFYLFKNLEILTLSNNLIRKIKSNYFCENRKLRILELDSNQIEEIEFSFLPKLEKLNLSYNRLTKISDKLFKNLPNLKFLYLDSNLISHIDPNAFFSNSNLLYLGLSLNFLLKIPNIDELSELQEIDLSWNQIACLKMEPFARKLNKTKKIKINLQQNELQICLDKTFCDLNSIYSENGFELLLDDINQFDKCMLFQIKLPNTKIKSNKNPSCEHLYIAKFQNIQLNGNLSLCPSEKNLTVDECLTKQNKFECELSDEFYSNSTLSIVRSSNSNYYKNMTSSLVIFSTHLSSTKKTTLEKNKASRKNNFSLLFIIFLGYSTLESFVI